MRIAIGLIAVLGVVCVASADTLMLRDLTDDSDLSPRDGVTAMGRDATGSFFQGVNGGYNVVDANIMHDGAFLDILGDTIEIDLMCQVDADVEWVGYWVRFYHGTWDGAAYSYVGWANAFFEVPNTGEWTHFAKAVADFEEPLPEPGMYEAIYKYRVDAVYWEGSPSNPIDFGIGSVPEPAALALLALGGLALTRRR